MAGYILRDGEKSVVLRADQIDRLLGRGDGDAALLYLCLLRNDGAIEPQRLMQSLRFSELRLRAAETALQELGLIDRPVRPQPQEPAQEPVAYTTEEVRRALEEDGEFRMLTDQTQNLLGKIMQSGKAIYAFTSFDANTPMLHLDIDRDKAEAMKVPISAIFSTLQSQLGSIYINDFNKYGKTYKVKMQSSEDFRRNLNIVSQLYVPSSTGALVPLDALATVRWTLGPRQTERFNMFPSASVNTQGVPFFSSGQMMNLVQNIVDTEFSHDYQLSWTDMSYQESQNEGMILYLMVLALTFAYLFLVAQYESWTMPISVILSVGTATLGGLLALWIFQMSFNIYCQLGLLMLIGLTAKTAILMVEYSKQERDAGQSVSDAALNGMRLRFRSVMMTALSFVIGVFPMVFASGAGAAAGRRSVLRPSGACWWRRSSA